ncbi:Dna2-domain-containing protein, partial [Meredithblackwellia eburnea MCA 4105]
SLTGKDQLQVLTVALKGSEVKHTVLLTDDWTMTEIQAGNTINLIGSFDSSTNPSLTLSRSSGLLILHPDILVSSTKVADSSHCSRKALLAELIRTTGPSTPALTYGNMLHELLQACMSEGRWDEDWVKEKVNEILRKEMMVLWGMELGVDQAREVLLEKSKGFEDFRNMFIRDKPGPHSFLTDARTDKPSARPRLAITNTIDIEEDIWSPKYGLKGKVDVSVAAKAAEGTLVASKEATTMPFEVKTGKSKGGMEHRAQTMLYTLLMSDRYNEEVASGLLYYSQTNEVIRVQPARNEIRGLIMARNEFALFLHRRMTLSSYENVGPSLAAPPSPTPPSPSASIPVADIEDNRLLPPPIDDPRSCKWCYSSDACMLFRKSAISDDDDNPLQVMFENRTGHLTSNQSEFFKKWEKLISLEEQELVRFKKEIWTMGAEERMKSGRCMANMAIDDSYEGEVDNRSGARIHRFTYRLQHAASLPTQATTSQRASRSLLGGTITVNDPIVISLEQPSVLAFARGFVLAIDAHSVVVGLDHSLTDIAQVRRLQFAPDPDELVFRIDKDELAAGMGRIRDNLIQLFVLGGDERRRRLVVDLEPPQFEHVPSKEKLIPSSLNEDQEDAVRKVLAAKDYALILGMPGTGKTTTIAEVLKALAKAGKSVLLTAYTHSAVDNILLKVKDSGLSILRLGNRDKIMPSLHGFTLDPLNPAETLTQLDNQLMMPQIVATTCLSINEDNGLDVSLFKRLSDAHPEAIVYLSQQYRMNEDIMLLSNKLVYEDRLRAGSEEVAKQSLVLPHVTGHSNNCRSEDCWIGDLLDPLRRVVFVDTDRLPANERNVGPLIDNELEASLVTQFTTSLIDCGLDPSEIGIITPYRQQTKLLARNLVDHPGVEILTADKSQGRDKQCIVMSMTRANPDGSVGDLLKDWRRINVCLTRAKSKLVVFGSRSTLNHAEILRRFFEIVQERGWIYSLPPGSQHVHDGALPVATQKRLASSSEAKLPGREVKRPRVGPGSLVLNQPMVKDVVNSLL